MKQTRARSKEAKDAKLEKIIKIGRELFIHQSEDGFSTSQLAREVGMKQASLYKYIESKRELWFAIVIHDLNLLVGELNSIAESHTGTQIDLLIKMAEFYFNVAIENDAIIRLSYRTDAPNSNKIGLYEKKYNPTAYYQIFQNVINRGIEQEEIFADNPTFFMFYLFSILHGATLLIGERGFKGTGIDPRKFKPYVMDRFKEALYKHKL